MALPESDGVKEDINFHLSIAQYFVDVLDKFINELQRDAPSPRSKWRSCYLDFHFAMALAGNSFTIEQHTTALEKIDRTWNDFLQKKSYAPVQQHGDDVCGSSRIHQHSLEEMITRVIEPHTIHKAAETKEIQKKKTLRLKNLIPADVNTPPADKAGKTHKASQNVNTKGSRAVDQEQRASKPNRIVKTTVSLVGSSIPANNSEIDAIDGDIVQNVYELQEGIKKPHNIIIHASTKEIVRSEMMIQPENENYSDTEDVVLEASPNTFETKEVGKIIYTSTNGVRHPKHATTNNNVKSRSKGTLESEVYRYASGDSDMEVDDVQEIAKNAKEVTKKVHKSTKGGRSRKNASQKKKAKSKETIESEEEAEPGDYDHVKFPHDWDDWDEYIEKVFKEGNSHIFLKLAAWISCRFRELAGISKDDELNGLVIPKHPGWFNFDSHDHFLEALGMERLYAATAHMDTHPEYLACIFRQLGELESANEMGSSHPRFRPLPSPPTPVASTESDDVGDHWVGNGTVKRKRTLSNATLTPQFEPVPAAKRVKGGIRSTSPAISSVTPASNSDFAVGGSTMTHPTLSPESVSSSISNITKALLLDESSGSTSEPADTREGVTDDYDSGSKRKSSETEVADLEAGAVSPSRPPITIQSEALISDFNTKSASDPSHPSKNDEEDWFADMLGVARQLS
ncbi:hypothetical protein BDR05DRAFT_953244 [Suillus weaverae]|nr:hypothetical protein BDR05DRAFT_953244 [Suillus weaverae]